MQERGQLICNLNDKSIFSLCWVFSLFVDFEEVKFVHFLMGKQKEMLLPLLAEPFYWK